MIPTCQVLSNIFSIPKNRTLVQNQKLIAHGIIFLFIALVFFPIINIVVKGEKINSRN